MDPWVSRASRSGRISKFWFLREVLSQKVKWRVIKKKKHWMGNLCPPHFNINMCTHVCTHSNIVTYKNKAKFQIKDTTPRDNSLNPNPGLVSFLAV